MVSISFNAGDIEATLTLDRDPFQHGLEEAKAEGQRFERESFKAKLDVTGDQETKQKIDSVEQSAKKLATSRPTVTMDGDDALLVQKIAKANALLAELQRQKATPKADLDIAAAEVQRQKLVDQLDALQAKKADPKIDLDIAAAEFRRAELVAKLDELQSKPYTVKAELAQDKLLLQIAQVQARLEALAAKKTALEIDTDEAAILVKIATVQERIDRLNGQKTTINIDADIGATEAKIAALEAQLAGLGETTAAAGDAASAAGAQFNWMAAGIGAAFPPAATAVLALSGALELAAIPLVAIKVGMAGIQAAAAPLAGGFLELQSVVSATFEHGLQPAITTVSALMPTLQSGLVGTAGALSTVAVEVGKVASSQSSLVALQASFSNIQATIQAMTPGIAGFVQNIIDLGELGTGALTGLAGIVNNLATQWHTMVASLTATGTAQAAIHSLVDVLGAVASIIPPLVQAGTQLMAVIGPPLAAALNVVAGAVQLLAGPLGGITTTVLVAVAAFTAASAATAALGTAIAGGAAAWATFRAFVTGATADTAASGAAASGAAAAQGTLAASVYETAAAATTSAATLTTAAEAAAANAVALEADAVTARAAAASLVALAAAGGDAAAAAAAVAAAATADTAALEAPALAARTAAAATGAMGASATASGAAAAAATARTGGFAAALTKGGAAAIGLAAAVAIGYVAVKSFTTSTDEAVSALGRGGQAAEDMRAKVQSQTSDVQGATTGIGQWASGVNEWINAEVFGIATMKSTQTEWEKHRASLTATQRAQEDATIAAGNYQQAVDKFGAGSIQATEAQKKLAEATLAVNQAQAAAAVSATNIGASLQAAAGHFGAAAQSADGAAQAAISYANALATLADPLASAGDKTKAFAADMANASDAPRNLLSAMNAANSSITSFAESSTRITPAMIDASGAINTTTKAGQEFATGILGAAKAADNLRGATTASSQAAGDSMVTSLAKGGVALEDFRQKLMAQAVAHGATKAQAQGLVDTYLAFPPSIKTEISQPGMTEAYVNALGLGKAITGLPSTTTVTVKTLDDNARQRLLDLGFTIKTLPNGQIIIGADIGQVDSAIALAKQQADTAQAVMKLKANPQQFYDSIRDGVGAALATTGANIPVGAVAEGFNNVLRDSVGAALATQAVVPVGADPGPFNGVVQSSLSWAGTQLAVTKLDAAPDLFNGKVQVALQLANGSTGIVALDGNPELVNGKVSAAVKFADGSTGRITVDGNPDPATGKVRAVVDFGNGQHTVVTIDPKDLASAAIAAIPREVHTVVVITSQDLRESHGGAGGGLVGFAGGGVVPSARRFATGGVLGGYAPGSDTIPAILSPGEAVLVPELVRRLGPGNILAANMEASGRQPTFWNGAKPVGGDGVALGPSVGSAVQGGGNIAAALDRFAARIEAAVVAGRGDSQVSRVVAAKVDDLVSEIRRGGVGASVYIQDRSGDPAETARSAMLALRLR